MVSTTPTIPRPVHTTPNQLIATPKNYLSCNNLWYISVFPGIKKRDSSCLSSSCITCDSANKQCSNVANLTCQCPCISRLDFNYCRNEFPPSKWDTFNMKNCDNDNTVKWNPIRNPKTTFSHNSANVLIPQPDHSLDNIYGKELRSTQM